MNLIRVPLLIVTATAFGCSNKPPGDAAPAPETEQTAAATQGDAALTSVLAGSWRSDTNKARDMYRHPAESLAFWGLTPGMTILEVQPGGGWWTEILAPYVHSTGGAYYATTANLADKQLSKQARDYLTKNRTELEGKFTAAPETYGQVKLIEWDTKSEPLPANTFDFILTARSIHGWINQGRLESAFTDFFTALKPGGILAVEQHRANPGPQDAKAPTGYVAEAYVIEQARKAGFELAGQSEVNANAKDTKDHPFGVWTLPPTRAASAPGSGKAADPSFDHAKYDAIGESDRMTLKFRKPT